MKKKPAIDRDEEQIMKVFGEKAVEKHYFKLGIENAKKFVDNIGEIMKKEVIMKLLDLEKPLMTTWFDGKKFKLQIVYRATRDGFGAD